MNMTSLSILNLELTFVGLSQRILLLTLQTMI